jgi:hypothetical protein
LRRYSEETYKDELYRRGKAGTDERFLDTGLARVLEASEVLDPLVGRARYDVTVLSMCASVFHATATEPQRNVYVLCLLAAFLSTATKPP